MSVEVPMGDKLLAARLALMTARAAFDDGRGHAPSLGDGIVILPDDAPLAYDVAIKVLANLADATPDQFLYCDARVIEGRLALACTPEGAPAEVAEARGRWEAELAREREAHGARTEGPELMVIDGVDKRERFTARWEDIIAFVQRYGGHAFGGSWSRPTATEALPPGIGAVWHTHQAGGIYVRAG